MSTLGSLRNKVLRQFWNKVSRLPDSGFSSISWFIFRQFPTILRQLGFQLLKVEELGPSNSQVAFQSPLRSARTAVMQAINDHQNLLVARSVNCANHSPRIFRVPSVEVRINYKFASAVGRGSLLLTPRFSEGPWDLLIGSGHELRGGIVAQRGSQVVISRETISHQLDSALYVGHRATYNWTHWLVDFLPAVFFANYVAGVDLSIPLVVAKDSQLGRGFRETLEVVLDRRPVIQLRQGESVFVKDLFWAEPLAVGGPAKQKESESSSSIVHMELFGMYLEHLVKNAERPYSVSRIPEAKRLFVERRDSQTRRYNQIEVRELLAKHGFQAVFAEDLSLGEKIQIFSSAELVVGENGSGMANLAFSSRGSKVLTWWGGSPFAIDHASTLSQVVGLEYYRLSSSAIMREPNDSNQYRVDVDQLENAILFLSA